MRCVFVRFYCISFSVFPFVFFSLSFSLFASENTIFWNTYTHLTIWIIANLNAMAVTVFFSSCASTYTSCCYLNKIYFAFLHFHSEFACFFFLLILCIWEFRRLLLSMRLLLLLLSLLLCLVCTFWHFIWALRHLIMWKHFCERR